MAAEVIWTRIALRDLEDAYQHIARDSAVAAEKVRLAIIESTRALESNPLLGAISENPKFNRYRELFCYRYRIFYRHDRKSRRVSIMRIWHGSRDEPERLSG